MTGLAIAAEGYIFIALLAAAAILLLGLGTWRGRWWLWVSGWMLAVAVLAVAFFFRDPERTGERGPGLYLAPADGEVMAVDRVLEPDYIQGPAVRVSIFLSVLDVHVQRSPVGGVVEHVEHRPGRFAAAWSEQAGTENERVTLGIDTGEERVVVRQIAGLVARRIVTYVEEGDQVEQGERIGLIRFGSRVDAYLPADVELHVGAGDRVLAGVTVLAAEPEAPPSPGMPPGEEPDP